MSKTPKTAASNGAVPHMSPADLAALEHETHAHNQSAEPGPNDAAAPTPEAAEPHVEGEPSAPSAQQELASVREQLLRMGADFENFRKRSRQEQDEQRRFSIKGVLVDMLPVVDNLERALLHAPQDNKDPVIEGVRMVAKQWHDVLGNYGVKAFKSLNERFDPERHEAVGQQTSPTNAPGTVLTEHISGYMIHERLLRPARVVVADQASGTELT